MGTQSRKIPFTKVGYAHHEAGHAVAIHVLGLPLGSVSIKHNRQLRKYGETFMQETLDLEVSLENRLMIFAAGIEGELMVYQQNGWKIQKIEARRTKLTDYSNSIAILKNADMVSPSEGLLDKQETILSLASAQARELLANNWTAVEALSSALLEAEDDCISARQAHIIIRQALGETEIGPGEQLLDYINFGVPTPAMQKFLATIRSGNLQN